MHPLKKLSHFSIWVMVGVVFITASTTSALQPDPFNRRKSKTSQKTNESTPQVPKYSRPELAPLEALLGVWKVREHHFNDQGEVIVVVKGQEQIKWILEGNVLQRSYISGERDPIFRAIGLLTFNEQQQAFVGTWYDSQASSGPSIIKGVWSAENQTMVFTVESADDSGSAIRYRVVEKFLDENHRTTTTYELLGSKVTKRMRVDYERTTICPASRPLIIGGDFQRRPKSQSGG